MNAALPRLGLIVALASLAACKTVGPDYALPEGSAFKRPQANAAFIDTQNPQVAANQALPDRWWSLYNDPVLDGLITQALRDNVELKAADAHLRRAAAVYEQALDAGGEAEAGVSRAQLSAESFLQEHELPVINLADGKFAVSYQFDLFGSSSAAPRQRVPTSSPLLRRATWPRSAWSRRWPTAIWKSATPTTSCTWPNIRCSCSNAAVRSLSA